jgi:hypothetical protein
MWIGRAWYWRRLELLLEKGRTWRKSDLELKHIPVGLRMSRTEASCQLGFQPLALP